MSGGLKAAKQALARPLDGMVRAERNSKSWRNARGRAAAARGGHGLFAHAHLDAQPEATRGSSLGLSAPRRGSSRSVRELARSALRTAHRAREPQDRAMRPSLARGPQARSSLQDGSTALPKKRALTFDMSGGPKRAKRALVRPLDGGVRRHGRLSTFEFGFRLHVRQGFLSTHLNESHRHAHHRAQFRHRLE